VNGDASAAAPQLDCDGLTDADARPGDERAKSFQ
jgi:hypothetical protein